VPGEQLALQTATLTSRSRLPIQGIHVCPHNICYHVRAAHATLLDLPVQHVREKRSSAIVQAALPH